MRNSFNCNVFLPADTIMTAEAGTLYYSLGHERRVVHVLRGAGGLFDKTCGFESCLHARRCGVWGGWVNTIYIELNWVVESIFSNTNPVVPSIPVVGLSVTTSSTSSKGTVTQSYRILDWWYLVLLCPWPLWVVLWVQANPIHACQWAEMSLSDFSDDPPSKSQPELSSFRANHSPSSRELDR